MDYFPFLRKVPLFADLPESDLKQICQKVHEVRLAPGDVLFHQGSMGKHAFVIVEGEIEIYKVSNGQKVQLAIRKPGEVIGEISLLESTPRNASGAATINSMAIAIKREQFDQLLQTSPSAARTMLHTVVTRLQSTEASLLQSEKMAQLGTFTAGIAHEINNPASAVQRGAAQLKNTLEQYLQISSELRSHLQSPDHLAGYHTLQQQIRARVRQLPMLDAITRMDRESDIEDWLDDHDVQESADLAQRLVELDYDVPAVQQAVASFPTNCIPDLTRWMVEEAEMQRLLDEIHQGAGRISDIVKALKSYVYLDEAPNQEIDIHEGLENTLIILRHKLKQGVEVVREYDRNLPTISAYGSELNQVWTNLIDNAIDAVGGRGKIILRTSLKDSSVVVEIIDNGSGIPPEVRSKLFYPFFTTKPVGKGTGLGLNISYRIVQKHGGDIQVFSQPGQTCFEVRLPVRKSSA